MKQHYFSVIKDFHFKPIFQGNRMCDLKKKKKERTILDLAYVST